MRFTNSRAGASSSFHEALSKGYPGEGGLFLPESLVDLRSTVYSPAAGFVDFIAVAASELLPELLDPFSAPDLLSLAYQPQPERHVAGTDLVVFDLAGGATGSSADYSASFAAAMLASLAASHGLGQAPLAVASASPKEAAALGAAFERLAPELDLLLLCPPGTEARLGGRGAARRVRILEVQGGLGEAMVLERLAGGAGQLCGRAIYPLGTATPLRLLGRSLLLIGLFSLARKGLSGDLLVCFPPEDLLALVTGLWTWSWGLPVSSFLLAGTPGRPSGLGDLLEGPVPVEQSAGLEALRAFNKVYPLGTLVLPPPELSGEVQKELCLPDGLALDLQGSLALQAARGALATGLSGHSTILVPRVSLPSWDAPTSVPSLDLSAPKIVAPRLSELEAVVPVLFS